MVFITLPWRVVGSEAFVSGVVIVISLSPLPSMTFYAEMVVAISCKVAISCATLKYALSQSDTCRNTIFQHLLYGQVFILVEIVLIFSVPCHLSVYRKKADESQGYRR